MKKVAADGAAPAPAAPAGKNRLQVELESRRASGRPVLDLIDTNFHANGFLFPREPLAEGFAAYAASRRYDPHPRGAPEARASIAAWYAAAGVSVGAESLLITASASESYHLLFNTLASPGDNVLLPGPATRSSTTSPPFPTSKAAPTASTPSAAGRSTWNRWQRRSTGGRALSC